MDGKNRFFTRLLSFIIILAGILWLYQAKTGINNPVEIIQKIKELKIFQKKSYPDTIKTIEKINYDEEEEQETINVIKTINYEYNDDGELQFYTNDYNNMDYLFYYFNQDPKPFVSYKFKTKKVSGNDLAGYGILFCYQDDSNYYRLLISSSGQYAISKFINGEFYVISEWEDSKYLNIGFDTYNTVMILKVGTMFFVKFNDMDELKFTDNSLSSGEIAFAVYVSDEEDFPQIPADTRFIEIND